MVNEIHKEGVISLVWFLVTHGLQCKQMKVYEKVIFSFSFSKVIMILRLHIRSRSKYP